MPATRLRLLVLATALWAAAGSASAYVATNGLLVRPEGADNFTVPFMGPAGDVDFWCAAGDYVNKFLGLPGGTRIYRLSEPPRPRGDGIRFSLKPDGAASRTGLTIFSSDAPQNSVSAAMASAQCPPRFFIFGFRGLF